MPLGPAPPYPSCDAHPLVYSGSSTPRRLNTTPARSSICVLFPRNSRRRETDSTQYGFNSHKDCFGKTISSCLTDLRHRTQSTGQDAEAPHPVSMDTGQPVQQTKLASRLDKAGPPTRKALTQTPCYSESTRDITSPYHNSWDSPLHSLTRYPPDLRIQGSQEGCTCACSPQVLPVPLIVPLVPRFTGHWRRHNATSPSVKTQVNLRFQHISNDSRMGKDSEMKKEDTPRHSLGREAPVCPSF